MENISYKPEQVVALTKGLFIVYAFDGNSV